MVSCLLGRLYPDLDAEEAMDRVNLYYKTRHYSEADAFSSSLATRPGMSSAGGRSSPETSEQEDQVRRYYEQVLGEMRGAIP